MVSLDDITRAQATIAGLAVRTPLIHAHALGRLLDADVYLKPEMLQRAGSFKLRGALNKIADLPPARRERGVIAASAGNHAQGVAMAAARIGIPAVVVMPSTAPHTKAAASRAYGAEVIRHGSSYHDAHELALQLAQERGLTLIPGFDDPAVIAGQGTVGLEIIEDLPRFDAILVPVGGGGLIAGIAVAVRAKQPAARIIGVQAELAPAVARSLARGRPVAVSPGPTIADGIAVERPGDLPFAIIKEYVDEVVTVGEADLANAIRLIAQRAKLVAEAAGAAPVAAALAGAVPLEGRTTVFVLSGGNVDLDRLGAILAVGMPSK
jgi:threonine dehydratase